MAERINKRGSIRIDTVILADVADTVHSITGRGCIVDLSMGGMKIETKDNLDRADYVDVTFALPNGTTFRRIRGRIMRKTKGTLTFIYGIRFVEISMWDRFKIFRHIHKI
jgi:c-di-GMP-binding flagellar brake protein YcgR